MKKTLIALIVAAASSAAYAQTVSTTTTTTTMGTGVVTSYTPGTSLIVKEEAGPVTYRYGDTVTYVTKSGRTLTAEQARTRIKVGAPISVSYDEDGDSRVISRVEVDDDGEIEIEKD